MRYKKLFYPESSNKKLIILWNRDSQVPPEVFKNIKTFDAAKRILRKRNSNNIRSATYEGAPI